MRSTTAMILLSVGAVGFLSGFALRGQTEEVSKGVNLKVLRTQVGGGDWYEPVLLKTYDIQFFEWNKRICAMSQLLEWDLDRDSDGHLTSMSVSIRAEPMKYKPVLDPGAQAAALLITRATDYEDLDGDSVLDTMVKVGPELHETYILADHHWVRVVNSKGKWGKAPVIQGFETKDKYRFGPGGWKRD